MESVFLQASFPCDGLVDGVISDMRWNGTVKSRVEESYRVGVCEISYTRLYY